MVIRHPLPLLTKEVPRLALHRGQTIVLAQDLHAPFADWDAGWLATRARSKVLLREFDEYADALALMRPNWQQVLAAARVQRITVVYSCLGYQPPQPPSIFQTATNWLWDLSGPAGQFPLDLLPQPADAIYAKPGWSALGNSEFCTYLAAQQVANVILLGTMLEFGLRQTALALADQGIGVLIVSDGVVPLTQAGGKQAAGELGHGLTKLRTTGELLALLDRLSTEETVFV